MLRVRHHLLVRVIRDERGVTGVEFGLIAALVGLAVVGAVSLLGHVLGSGYTSAANSVPAASGPAAAKPASSASQSAAATDGTVGGAAGGGSAGSVAAAPAGAANEVPGRTSEGATKADEQMSADEAATVEEAAKIEAQAKADEIAKAEAAAKDGDAAKATCIKKGLWYDESAGTCESSAKSSCVGDQVFDESSNNCNVPKCEDKAYDAKSGTCVESLAKACQAEKQGYSEQTNTCYACPVAFDGATGTCVPQKDCSADNRMPNAWNFCLTVDEYVGTTQGASLSSVGNGWLPQRPGTTTTYNVFSAKDTKSWKDEPWLLSTSPYAAEIVSAVVSDPSKGLKVDMIPTPTFTKDTLTVTTPKGPEYAQYTVTYTVVVTYPWNGTTKTVTKTVSTKVGLQ